MKRVPLLFLILGWLLLVGCGGDSTTNESATGVPDGPEVTEPAEAQPTAAEATGEPTAAEATGEPTIVPTETEAITDDEASSRYFASPEYGMQAFMWWRPEVADRDLGLIRDAGFGWVKQDFAWREIEGAEKGAFDWSRTDTIVDMTERFGINVLARVDRQPAWATGGQCAEGIAMGPPDNLSDFTDFLTELATRYKGRIKAYSIWNEPNLAREWCDEAPDPAAYMELLKLSYEAIKAVDPDAIVISAGLTPTGGPMPTAMEDTEFLRGMYAAAGGTLDGYADVLGAHAPGFKAPPELSPDEVMADQETWGRGRYFTFRRVEDLRAIMEENGDTERQIAILEMGWTTDPRPDSPYNWHAVTEAEKADYLVRAYAYAEENWSPWIGLMSLIYVCNYDWTPDDEQYYWCINAPSYPENLLYPSYYALQAMPKQSE
ncbi:MAG: cellulase family glycosylhydrolase [Anaerolineales bacterium]|nr:cellulase family glycosylhydrolase [Anaerolineales bacterium]MCB9127729.1 cellulase family glycosylhydrolase [Ardenticatenales bacterium]